MEISQRSIFSSFSWQEGAEVCFPNCQTNFLIAKIHLNTLQEEKVQLMLTCITGPIFSLDAVFMLLLQITCWNVTSCPDILRDSTSGEHGDVVSVPHNQTVRCSFLNGHFVTITQGEIHLHTSSSLSIPECFAAVRCVCGPEGALLVLLNHFRAEINIY